jgi:D-3-phosphoglycerate dehydrogenase
VLGEINSRLSSHGINIVGQYLNTNSDIGYVILDVESKLSKEAFGLLKDVPGTLKSRIVY